MENIRELSGIWSELFSYLGVAVENDADGQEPCRDDKKIDVSTINGICTPGIEFTD